MASASSWPGTATPASRQRYPAGMKLYELGADGELVLIAEGPLAGLPRVAWIAKNAELVGDASLHALPVTGAPFIYTVSALDPDLFTQSSGRECKCSAMQPLRTFTRRRPSLSD